MNYVLSVAAFDATLSWVVATKTVRLAKLKVLLALYQKKGSYDPGSKRSVCEVPWELQGRRAGPGQQSCGWSNLAEEQVLSWPWRMSRRSSSNIGRSVLGNRSLLNYSTRKPGMSRKMSCSLYGRRIQDTERMKGEKSGWVDGPDFEFLLYSIRQRFSGGGFMRMQGLLVLDK